MSRIPLVCACSIRHPAARRESLTRFRRPGAVGLAVGVVLAATWVPCRPCLAQEVVITPRKASGISDVGEKIEWRIEVRKQTTPPITRARYALKKGGLTVIKEGTLDLSSGPATLQASLAEPGTILAEVLAGRGGQKVRALAGAAVAPERIRPSAPRPADFDAFWQAKIDQLNAIPPNPQLEPADSGTPGVEYFKLRLDNIGKTHVYGQLARPRDPGARKGKYPALLLLQYAGIYGLPKSNVVPRAAAGWLTLNIMAHDLPFDRTEAFYQEAARGPLKDYLTQGDESRETSYFLRMYLGCYRAADYLAQRPDWDGKTLVVMGLSQGGQQSLVAAALHPKVTALVALGLIDETSPPAGVFAACNQLRGPREVVVMVSADHEGHNHTQKQFAERSEAWLKALLAGEPVPPPRGRKPASNHAPT